MTRLRNVRTGAVVSVRDEKAERMGSEWERVADAAEPATTPKRPRAKSAAKTAAKPE